MKYDSFDLPLTFMRMFQLPDIEVDLQSKNKQCRLQSAWHFPADHSKPEAQRGLKLTHVFPRSFFSVFLLQPLKCLLILRILVWKTHFLL